MTKQREKRKTDIYQDLAEELYERGLITAITAFGSYQNESFTRRIKQHRERQHHG